MATISNKIEEIIKQYPNLGLKLRTKVDGTRRILFVEPDQEQFAGPDTKDYVKKHLKELNSCSTKIKIAALNILKTMPENKNIYVSLQRSWQMNKSEWKTQRNKTSGDVDNTYIMITFTVRGEEVDYEKNHYSVDTSYFGY